MKKQYEESIKMSGFWLPVDADNIINFNGIKLSIPFNNKDYKVKSSYTKGWNYENESVMDKSFVVIGNFDGKVEIVAYNENLERIGGLKVNG